MKRNDYQVMNTVAPLDDFLRIRVSAGMTMRPRSAAKRALQNSLFGAHVIYKTKVIGMGRVVGDGFLNFNIVDVAVEPQHQNKGVGNLVMLSIMGYLNENAPSGAYITLIADEPRFYLKYGFHLSRPDSEGMYILKL